MGGNSSYSKGWGGVQKASRTHIDTGFRIEKHKVIFFKDNPMQKKNVLNSHSENATYLIATKSEDGTLAVQSIDVFKGHDLCFEINLEFDPAGNVIPYSEFGKGSHAHYWEKGNDGILRRKSHDKNNFYEIDQEYDNLIEKIKKFNKQKNKYENG